MLVELGVVEQRYRAVLEVLEEGAPVVEALSGLAEVGDVHHADRTGPLTPGPRARVVPRHRDEHVNHHELTALQQVTVGVAIPERAGA